MILAGMEILPCSILQNSATQWQVKFCNVVTLNGAGTYSFRVRSAINLACIYSVQGTTPLATDGGFVSDPRDDNVQQTTPQGNNGIQRNPLEGVPSYYAFALSLQHYPVQATSVAFYIGGVYSQSYPVNTRFHCSAPYIAGAFTCRTLGFYHAKVR